MFTGLVETIGKVLDVQPLDVTTEGGGGYSLTIENAKPILEDVRMGDSIAINGACMTVTEFDIEKGIFKVGVSPETLRKTNLGEFVVGTSVNLERAMRLGDRFGGHYVQGHVDCSVVISKITPDEPNSIIIEFKVPKPRQKIVNDNKDKTVKEISKDKIEDIKAKVREWSQEENGWSGKETSKQATNKNENQDLVEGEEAPTDIDYLRYIVPKGFITLDGTSLTVIDVDNEKRTFSVMLIKYTQERVILSKKKIGDRVNIEVDQMGKYAERAVIGVLSKLGFDV